MGVMSASESAFESASESASGRVRKETGMQSKRAFCGLLWCVCAGGFAASGAETGGVLDVKVTTDTSIDCSSVQSIARDLYRNCKTDEEKAIATWYFVRRMLFHWPHVPTWDSLDLINSYGWGLCGYQSHTFCHICNAGGVKARVVHAPSHVVAEAWYDDAWHLYDCQVGWFAYRKDKSAVASGAEMKADNSIIVDAVKDGRASAPWFQCSDKHGVGLTTVNGHRPGGVPNTPTRRLIINLRRGETLTRIWGNEGRSWTKPGEEKWTSPRHTCTRQQTDANDPVNWPFWKPYAEIQRKEGEKVIYGVKRYFGNGRLEYEPDLSTEAFMDGLTGGGGMEGVKAKYQGGGGPNVHPAEAGKAGSLIFVVELPYVMVDAWVEGEAFRKSEADAFTIQVKGPGGDWQKVFEAEQSGRFEFKDVSVKAGAWAAKKYLVKLEMRGAAGAVDAGLERFKITTVFMNNMYALPYFAPGRNTIRVEAAEGTDLKKNALALEYAWEEEGVEKSLKKAVDKLPFECVVEVGGKEMPRMKFVRLSVAR